MNLLALKSNTGVWLKACQGQIARALEHDQQDSSEKHGARRHALKASDVRSGHSVALPMRNVPRAAFKRRRRESHVAKRMWVAMWSAATWVIGLLESSHSPQLVRFGP